MWSLDQNNKILTRQIREDTLLLGDGHFIISRKITYKMLYMAVRRFNRSWPKIIWYSKHAGEEVDIPELLQTIDEPPITCD